MLRNINTRRAALVAVVRRTMLGGRPGLDDVLEATTQHLRLAIDADAAQRPGLPVAYLAGIDTDCLTLADLRAVRALLNSPEITEFLARAEAEQVAFADVA